MLVKFIIILGEEAQIKQSHMTLLFFQLPVVAPRVEIRHSCVTLCQGVQLAS